MKKEDSGDTRRDAPAPHHLGQLPLTRVPVATCTTTSQDECGETIVLPIQLAIPEHVLVAAYLSEAGARLVGVCGGCGDEIEFVLDLCARWDAQTECSASWNEDAAAAIGQILDAIATLRGSWAPTHQECAGPGGELRTSTSGAEAVIPGGVAAIRETAIREAARAGAGARLGAS